MRISHRHSILSKGTISLKKETGNGAENAIAYLQGDAASSILFAKSSIPREFTLCSLSRYTGGPTNTILSAADAGSSWFHGHANGNVGVEYYDRWKTSTTSLVSAEFADNWLVMCGQNKMSGVQIANGIERSILESGHVVLGRFTHT